MTILRTLLALFLLIPAASAQENTLRVAATAVAPQGMDPFRNTGMPDIFIWSSLFDGLTRIDETGTIMPWLALSWRTLDPLTWEIKLRPGVTFSNGAPFTADAVVTAVNYLTSPAAARSNVARELRFLKEARRIDDLTVHLVTTAPTPHLPRTLPLLYAVEPTLWAKLGPDGYGQQAVGTGPFKVDRFDVGSLKMSAFTGSWRAPKVDRLEWTAAPEASSRMQALLSDRADIALNLGPDELMPIEAAGQKGLTWLTTVVWAYQFLHYKDTPLKDVRVRQAVNYAVDRQTLIDGLLAGATKPATQPSPRTAYGYDPSIPPIPYDPATAKKLLAEAGYPNGFKFVVQAVIGSGPSDAAVYQKVAQDLAAIGVTMEVRPMPLSELFRGVAEGGFTGDAFGMSFAAEPTMDALRTVQNHSCLQKNWWYCDERIMPTITAAQQEFDEAKGLKLRHEIMRFYRDQYMCLFLYDLPRFAGVRANVDHFKEVSGFISFEAITKGR